jgi:hypothetical protein
MTPDVAAIAAPRRVQLSRKKGWRMPANTVSVARPGRWGNPFTVEIVGSADLAVDLFRDVMTWGFDPFKLKFLTDAEFNTVHTAKEAWSKRLGFRLEHLAGAQRELRGKNLACWCPLDQPCHADILLELANQGALLEDTSHV